jgi:hypothetical protein
MSRQSVRLMIDPLGLLFPVWTSSKRKAKRGGVAAESAVHGPIHWSEAVGGRCRNINGSVNPRRFGKLKLRYSYV